MKKLIRIFIYLFLFSLVIGCFIYLGKKDFGNKPINYTDAEKFSMEYPNVGTNNVFNYINSSEVLNIFDHGSGIIYMGFASNEWSQYYVKYLNEVVKDSNIKEIYYYDLLKDRTKQNKNYQKIEKYLADYLDNTDDNKKYLFTPALMVVKEGKINYFNDETSLTKTTDNPKDYWGEEKINAFKLELSTNIGSD